MDNRQKFHFEPNTGWINDPNGLCYWHGLYHAFFQYNPYSAHWATMHWGHAVSEDLLHWEEKPIALYPDQPYDAPYDNRGGCYSGSAAEKDGRLYLFYTSVSEGLGQTQSIAWTDDGETFVKYPGNPLIDRFPEDGSKDFRDPKVFRYGEKWHMVVASGKDGIGKILHYVADDLFAWTYAGVLFASDKYGPILECPDLFPLGDKWILMFSKTNREKTAVQFLIGTFDGNTFTAETEEFTELGPHYYAPQTFLSPDGRRILIGWMHAFGSLPADDGIRKGGLTIPRQLSLRDGRLLCAPIDEAKPLLTDYDAEVHVTSDAVWIDVRPNTRPCRYDGEIRDVKILRDTRTVEVFINGGEAVLSYWSK